MLNWNDIACLYIQHTESKVKRLESEVKRLSDLLEKNAPRSYDRKFEDFCRLRKYANVHRDVSNRTAGAAYYPAPWPVYRRAECIILWS